MSNLFIKYVEHCLRAGTRPAPAKRQTWLEAIISFRNLGNNILSKIVMGSL